MLKIGSRVDNLNNHVKKLNDYHDYDTKGKRKLLISFEQNEKGRNSFSKKCVLVYNNLTRKSKIQV